MCIKLYIYIYICMCIHSCHSVCVEVNIQLTGVGSFLLFYGFGRLNSGQQAKQQVPFPAEKAQ